MRDGASFEAVCWFMAEFVCNDLAKGLYEICSPVGPVLMLYGDCYIRILASLWMRILF